MSINQVGFWSGSAAFAATVAYGVVQLLQVAGVLTFPADEILIYGVSLCIVVPLILEMLALHHLTPPDRQFWSHGALIFTVIYAVFVTANYVVQLATVIPVRLSGNPEAIQAIRVLEQTPHSLFWDFDAIGYVAMALACLMAIPAVEGAGSGRRSGRVRGALLAHALVTPLICIVYFSPTYSFQLLLLGLPWAFTAPTFMLLLARMLRESRADCRPIPEGK